MSPEQIIKRAGVYKKLALRDKLEVNQQRQSLLLLVDELEKSTTIKTQLEKLIEQEKVKNPAESARALHSASWFNTKIRDQLELVSNRCLHLNDEIQQHRKILAEAERRRTKKAEKADQLVSKARRDKQDKQDAELCERRRSTISKKQPDLA